jgi:hypothetical protein
MINILCIFLLYLSNILYEYKGGYFMPKITFIKNIDEEIIYPKTHIDAILTDDGLSINEKFDNITKLVDAKADSDHKHDYNTLTNKPTSLPANGGNCDTIDNKTVDDSIVSQDSLWTSEKTYQVIQEYVDDKIGSGGGGGGSSEEVKELYIGPTKPVDVTDTKAWIDTNNNVMKYYYNGNWYQLTFNISFIEEI